MKCTIPGNHIKVFGRAIHSLAKIGDEVFVDPGEDGVSFRTVSALRSGYASFLFSSAFFTNYTDERDKYGGEPVRCKIPMKSCLSVFRSLSSLEKSVEKCNINVDGNHNKLVFQLICRHDIMKTYSISFIDSETLQVMFDTDSCSYHLVSQSKLLSDIVINFQSTQEEITLVAKPDRVVVRNYFEEPHDVKKSIHTELGIDPGEFDTFTVSNDAEITFSLRDLRALLGFTDAAAVPVEVSFETSGKPIVFAGRNPPLFEVLFILTTLSSMDCEEPIEANVQPSETSHQKTSKDVSTSALNSYNNNSAVQQVSNISAAVPLSNLCDSDVACPPPYKKARFIFQRCFNTTFHPSQMPGWQNILERDSDEEG